MAYRQAPERPLKDPTVLLTSILEQGAGPCLMSIKFLTLQIRTQDISF